MKKIKKILCVFLVVLMCITSAPLSGFVGLDFSAEATTEYKVGDIIQFGSYPQSEVKDSATINVLNKLAPEWDEWISYGYYSGLGDYGTMVQGDWMRYTDVIYNGNKYRGVKFTRYRTYWTYDSNSVNTVQDDNGYYTNNIYWFKFEPINWRILDINTGLVMCNTIIDSQPYSNTIYRDINAVDWWGEYFNDSSFTNYASDYETSSIRKWLNNDFYNTAFADSEKVDIETTTLNNDSCCMFGEVGHEELNSDSTNDKIFSLSLNEVRNSDFGFESYDYFNASIMAYGSEYAKIQGLSVSNGSKAEGFSNWILRSAGYSSDYCCGVASYGAAGVGYSVSTNSGIRPAMRLDFDSNEDQNNSLDNIDNEKNFINQHINFVKGTENFLYDKAINDFRFANTIWENMDSGIKNHAELAHDIIEGSLEMLTLQFADGLKSGANPYEVILLDFLASNVTQSYFVETVKEDAFAIAIDIINDTIKMFDYEFKWSENFNLKDELKNLISASDYSGNHLYQSLNTFFYGKAKKEVKTVFESFECCGKLLDFLDAGLSVADFFVEMLRYTVAIEAFHNSAEVYKTILREISSEMYNVNNKYAEKFDSTLSFYEESLDYNSVLAYVIENKGIGGGFNLIYKMTSSILSKATYSMIMKIFKVGSSVAGQINAALWAADVGFGLSNMLTGNDTLVNCRRLLRATYMLDVASYNVMKRFETVLVKNENYGAALLFDNAFSFYKNVQLYSVNTYKKYCETSSTKWLSVNKEHFKNELAATVARIKLWNEYRCHFDSIENKRVADIDTVVVACPTDVYIYRKSDNKLVASVIDNISKSYTNEVAIICVDEEKALACDSIDDYKIEIVATGNGTMDVIYNSYSDLQNIDELNFSAIPINSGDSYVLDSDKEYVKRDDGVAYKENGSVEGCPCNCHKNGIAKFFFKIALFFQKIFKKNQVCDCGIKHY